MWWSGMVCVAGTQHHTESNKRPQQAAFSSNKILFCRPNQHEDHGHSQPNIYILRARLQRKQANDIIDSFLETTTSAKFVFLWPPSTTNLIINDCWRSVLNSKNNQTFIGIMCTLRQLKWYMASKLRRSMSRENLRQLECGKKDMQTHGVISLMVVVPRAQHKNTRFQPEMFKSLLETA